MTEFKSRRELREAERLGLVAKPEQVFDLPTGSIALPDATNPNAAAPEAGEHDIASAAEMLTRRKIREMERDGLIDPPTGAITIPAPTPASESTTQPSIVDELKLSSSPSFDEILAESEEPLTGAVNVVSSGPADSSPAGAPQLVPAQAAGQASVPKTVAREPYVQPTDIFHEMAVDPHARKPRRWIWWVLILLVMAGAAAGAYMLGIFK